MMRRCPTPDTAQCYMTFLDKSPEVRSVPRSSPEKQKEFWAQKFKGAGWETERFLDALETTDNFYCQEILQVKIPTWHADRVVLLGDAAHCPSPFTGMGTTSALVGAYVLAGEISKSSDDLPAALKKYEETLRPFVEEIQKISPMAISLGLPASAWGIRVLYFIVWVVAKSKIADLLTRYVFILRKNCGLHRSCRNSSSANTWEVGACGEGGVEDAGVSGAEGCADIRRKGRVVFVSMRCWKDGILVMEVGKRKNSMDMEDRTGYNTPQISSKNNKFRYKIHCSI